EQHGPVVSLAPQHDAVSPGELANYLRGGTQSAIQHGGHRRDARLDLAHDVVAQRRNLAIVSGRPRAQHRLARVHDDRAAARPPATMPSTNSSSDPRSGPPNLAAAARALSRRDIPSPPSSCASTTPMRSFTVTGIFTAARIAATHSATNFGRSIRQAPKAPEC